MRGKILLILPVVLLAGCATSSVYNSTVLDHSAYKNIGSTVNYTAKEKRVFVDRKEIEMVSDTHYQANITDYGNVIKYNAKDNEILFTPISSQADTHNDWDYLYAANYYVAKVIRKSDIDGKKPTMVNKRVEARITLLDSTLIEYSDSNKTITFNKVQRPVGGSSDWDELYHSEDKAYGLFRSIKKSVYRLWYIDASGNLWQYDFVPKFELSKSTSKGVYRLAEVSQSKAVAFDFLPTKNFICADLIKQYASIRQRQGQELAKTIILGLLQAYTSYSVTAYSGTSRSSYRGVYNDSWGSGSWSGYGTNYYSGYSRTYDYSFIGDRTKDLLDIAFNPNAGIENIKTAMRANGCRMP